MASTSTSHDHSAGTAGCPGCARSVAKIKVKVSPKCVVQFRPHADWAGEFGFDWVREGHIGDAYTKAKGDCCYRDIIGKYTKKDKAGNIIYGSDNHVPIKVMHSIFDSMVTTYFKPFPVGWKKGQYGKGPFQHITPWIALYPKDECKAVDTTKESAKQFIAKVTLYLEVKSKEPQVLRFESSPDPDALDISPKEIAPVKVGKYTQEVTISCMKPFDKDQVINVYPYKKLAGSTTPDPVVGSLQVLRNSKPNRYVANVVIVKVRTKLDGIQKKELPGIMNRDIKSLQKVLFQALTSLNYEVVTDYLDMTSGTDPYFHTCYVTHKGPHSAKKVITSDPDPKIPGAKKLHEYLKDAFVKVAKKDYSHYYKIFCFAEAGGSDRGKDFDALDGEAGDIPADSVVVWLDHLESVVPHELLHAMNFYHSFDNDGTYVYKSYKTDNLMDYSDILPHPIPLISLWKWQWDRLHDQVTNAKTNGRIKKE